MAFTTVNKGSLNMSPKLYTGNGSTNAITGVGFQPDLTWIKIRDAAGESHSWWDAVRTATKYISSNNTNIEATDATGLTAFDSDGFTLGSTGRVNQNSNTFASWNWKANGAGSSNSNGSITSTVSANTTAEFSIVSWTGTSTNATVGHGLGSIPKMIIVKNRDNTTGWGVYHASLGNTKYLQLNDSAAEGTASTFWNDTTPTNQVFSIGTSGWVNNTGEEYIAYCFADVNGYSKMGKYTGIGQTSGSFIYTGFKPAFILIKRTTSAYDWYVYDNQRPGYNDTNLSLRANTDQNESTSSGYPLDILSNGFKIRTDNAAVGGNADPYIYAAFGQTIVGTNNVPATTRVMLE